MSNWRRYKQYCLNQVNTKQFEQLPEYEKIKSIHNSFKRKANIIINTKKFKWVDKVKLMNMLKTQSLRKAKRLINESNVVEGFEDTDMFLSRVEKIKCIKINEPNDLFKFYNFL